MGLGDCRAMKITIPYKYIKSADIFRNQKDIRKFCQGFQLRNGKLMTTNGHYLFMAPVEHGNEILFNFIGKIPTGADNVEIDLDDNMAVFTHEKNGVVAQLGIEIIDALCFDEIRVTNSFNHNSVDTISFQGKYLGDIAKASKILGVDAVVIEPSGSVGVSRIKIKECEVYLMPCRI